MVGKMAEHTPNRFLLSAMSFFFWGMAAAALGFWLLSVVWPGGPRGLIGDLGPGLIAVFIALHIPAAITGILLWQWRRHQMRARTRVMLEAAALYFGLAVLFGLFMNYLLVSILGPGR